MLDASPPTFGLLRRFGPFVERMQQAIAGGIGRDHATLGPLAVMLFGYLGRILRRMAAIEARLAAGVCAPARPRAAAGTGRRVPSAVPRRPRGPVLLRFHAHHLVAGLRELVEAPETATLLEAAPEAGRLLRPLWRMLTNDGLPEVLRLPKRPLRSGAQVLSRTKSDPGALPSEDAASSWPEPPPTGAIGRAAPWHALMARCRGQPVTA